MTLTQIVGGFLCIVCGLSMLAGIGYYGLTRFAGWLLGDIEEQNRDLMRRSRARDEEVLVEFRRSW